MGWITRARDERQQAAAGRRELAARSEAYQEPDVPVRIGAQADAGIAFRDAAAGREAEREAGS